jgi:hypothetical protein
MTEIHKLDDKKPLFGSLSNPRAVQSVPLSNPMFSLIKFAGYLARFISWQIIYPFIVVLDKTKFF